MIFNIIYMLFFFIIGLILNNFRIINQNKSRILSKIIINITMPAIIFLTIIKSDISINNLILFPIYSIIISLLVFSLMFFYEKFFLKTAQKQRVVILSSVCVVNLGYFLYPIFQLYFGYNNLIYLIAFDIGNMILAFTLSYFIFEYQLNYKQYIKKIIFFPPIISIILSFILIYFFPSFSLPNIVEIIFNKIANINIILAMIVLGMNFTFSIKQKKILFSTIVIRMMGGATIAYVVSIIFNLSNIEKTTIILASSMPIGLTVLFYSLEFKQDIKLAANLVSISLLIGFILMILFNFKYIP